MVFGSKGMLGTDLRRHAPQGVQLIPHDMDVDITDGDAVARTISEAQPDWVINTAAYSHVDGCEQHPTLSFQVTEEGPRHIAEACSKTGAIFIQISTDYVFDGNKGTPYSEGESPGPLGIYGLSKLKGEMALKSWAKHYILRISTLYGSGRVNHAERVLSAVKNKSMVKIASDLFGNPTYTGDLAKWIYQLTEKRPLFGIYHLCHVGVASRWEFAEALCDAVDCVRPFPIESIRMQDLNLPAKRPINTGMTTEKWEREVGPLLSWREGMMNYLNELSETTET